MSNSKLQASSCQKQKIQRGRFIKHEHYSQELVYNTESFMVSVDIDSITSSYESILAQKSSISHSSSPSSEHDICGNGGGGLRLGEPYGKKEQAC